MIQKSKIEILLVGCGRMGGAILTACLHADIIAAADVLDPALPPENFTFTNSRLIDDSLLKSHYDVVVLAVKPQIMDVALKAIKNVQSDLFLSIAAGLKIEFFEKFLGHNASIIRAMPNTPAAIGQGITVCVANEHVSESGRLAADKILQTIGHVEWLGDETLLDAVTALSGSGPAYIFHLTEAMAQAGIEMGLDSEMAMRLARQTVIGSAALMAQSPQITAAQLREQVTSPNGTTAAALSVLMKKNGLQSLINEALFNAKERSYVLSNPDKNSR